MSMVDMLHHAHNTPLLVILARMNKMASDYQVDALPPPDSWKYSVTMERAAFINAFYDYAREHPLSRADRSTWVMWLHGGVDPRSNGVRAMRVWSRAASRIQRFARSRLLKLRHKLAAAKAAVPAAAAVI
jgi:hypothetical protein